MSERFTGEDPAAERPLSDDEPAHRPEKGVPLEPLPEEEPADVKALDVCPSCGAALGGIDTLVCLRCGFDLKTMRPLKTAVGPSEVISTPQLALDPISPSGRGDLWLPTAVAISAVALMTIGYLAGAPGLLHGEQPATILMRFLGLIKYYLSVTIFAACAFAALAAYARGTGRALGDWRLAAARVLAIIATTSLVGFIRLGTRGWEWSLETLLQVAAFVGLAMLMFRLAVRDALALVAILLVAVLVLLLISAALTWAITPV